MQLLAYALRKLAYGIPLVIGVTLLSFVLMVYFGPDQSWVLAGKNPSVERLAEIRAELGYDQPFWLRYFDYLRQLATLDFGLSNASGERVSAILARTVPVSLALMLPGFVLGNLLGVALGLLAAWYRGRWPDRIIMSLSVVGMSVSFLVVIILLQLFLSTPGGLDLFPVRGWDMSSPGAWLRHVTVPSLAIIFVTLGYNTRFYRAVLVEAMSSDHVRTARAFGAPGGTLMLRHVLRNSLIPILTRVMFSIPLVLVSGSLLLETYFGIPGIGKAAYDAITSGDQPVMLAVVSLTAVLFVLVMLVTDLLYRLVDPRVALR